MAGVIIWPLNITWPIKAIPVSQQTSTNQGSSCQSLSGNFIDCPLPDRHPGCLTLALAGRPLVSGGCITALARTMGRSGRRPGSRDKSNRFAVQPGGRGGSGSAGCGHVHHPPLLRAGVFALWLCYFSGGFEGSSVRRGGKDLFDIAVLRFSCGYMPVCCR